jgi:hypothetical protein
MTTLLDRAISEIKKRSDREQEDIARDILARIREPVAQAPGSVLGRGRAVMSFADPNDDMINILTEEDIAARYAEKLVAP